MNNKKKIILGSIIGIMLGLLMSTTYAIFSYNKLGNNNQIIAGDIYMHYNESNTLTIENALPSNTYDPNNYFEFTIKGKNTNKKYNIVYDINLNYGDEIANKIRIGDRFLKFRLVEVVNNEETELLTDKSYLSIDNKRIYVSTINKNTNSEITRVYRLYVWIDKSVVIGNTDYSDYSLNDWNNVYGSVKVSVTGDFSEKEIQTEPYLVMKNFKNDSNWKTIRSNITSIEFHTDGVIPNDAITSFNVSHSTSNGDVILYTIDDGLGNNTYKAVIVGDNVIYAPENCMGLFYNMSKLTSFNSKNFMVDNATNMSSIFYNCINLSDISSLLSWNTSKVTDIAAMFSGCNNLVNIDGLKNWNVASVTDMSYMFSGCNNLVDISGLVGWNTSNVTNMSCTFRNCYSLKSVQPIQNWNVEKVGDMYAMFQSCVNIEEIDLSNWKTTSLTNIGNMFGMWNDDGILRLDSKLKRIILSNQFNTINVTNMSELFANNTNIEDYSFLEYLDTSNVEGSLRTMFQYNYGLQNEDLEYIKNWNVGNVTNFEWMFAQCRNLTDASAINNWNISSSASFTNMFKNTPVHPEFTNVSGIWDSNGTFTPTV